MNQVDLPDALQQFLEQRPAPQHEHDTLVRSAKALLALGCQIEPPAPLGSDAATAADARRSAVAKGLDDPAATVAVLLALWREREKEPDPWCHTPELYQQLGKRALGLGAPFVALEVAAEGLERWAGDVRLRQIQGLAWARSGAPEQANQILGELAREGHIDEETLGTLARTHKDFGLRAVDPAERQRHLRTAYEVYAWAYQLTGGHWTGINAATVATLLGDGQTAGGMVPAVRKQCLDELKTLGTSDEKRYWPLASLGEAALNLGEWSEAEWWYREAAAIGYRRLGDLNSTRQQARILLKHLGQDSRWIDEILRLPRVVVFAGHMSDQPGRRQPRFPARLEQSVQNALRERLRKLDARVGYASAACGSDILFLEALLDLKGEVHVVLPYDSELFARDSVAIVPEARWRERYDSVLRRASRVVTASDEKMESGSVSYDYANLVLHGLATVRAKEFDTELAALTVWDGRPGDGPGGTASVIERWRKLGVPVERIDLAEMLRQAPPEPVTAPGPAPASSGGVLPSLPDTRVLAMLFADAVEFSKLPERQVVSFARHCLGAIADLLHRSPHKAVVKETRGDGVYLVFETVRDAGLFALDLCDVIRRTNWKEKDLPETLRLRIGVHAGPVCRCYDPIIEKWTYTGTHVCRTARIEPITPAGQVYASQAFAALAAMEKVAEFTCDYVKRAAWAKQYGTFPTYVVRRS